MHGTALAFARQHITTHAPAGRVIEFGSLDINGSPRALFGPDVEYLGIDRQDGPGVDLVADVVTLDAAAAGPAGLVLCMEVLEHAPDQRGIIAKASQVLGPGGWLILTAACDPRAPHSAIDELPIRPWEHYCNVDPAQLAAWLGEDGGWQICSLDTSVLGDVYLCAQR